MRRQNLTAFYLETLLLIAVFVAIILVLTQVFGLSRVQSAAAGRLNGAVCLAQNAAEAFSAAEDAQALCALLDENGSAAREGDLVRARYDADLRPDAAGGFTVEIACAPGAGGLAEAEVRVYWGGADEPVYTLRTASYRGGAA